MKKLILFGVCATQCVLAWGMLVLSTEETIGYVARMLIGSLGLLVLIQANRIYNDNLDNHE